VGISAAFQCYGELVDDAVGQRLVALGLPFGGMLERGDEQRQLVGVGAQDAGR
jgi:hypothetical protein